MGLADFFSSPVPLRCDPKLSCTLLSVELSGFSLCEYSTRRGGTESGGSLLPVSTPHLFQVYLPALGLHSSGFPSRGKLDLT